jgi:hypothetical protein
MAFNGVKYHINPIYPIYILCNGVKSQLDENFIEDYIRKKESTAHSVVRKALKLPLTFQLITLYPITS